MTIKDSNPEQEKTRPNIHILIVTSGRDSFPDLDRLCRLDEEVIAMTSQNMMRLAAVVVAAIVGSTSLTGAAFAHGGGGGGGGMGGAAISIGGGPGGGIGGGGRDGGGFGGGFGGNGFGGDRVAAGGHFGASPIGAMSAPLSHGGRGYGFGHPSSGGFYNRFDGSHRIDRFLPYALGSYDNAPFGYYGSASCTQLQTFRTASGGWVTRPVYVCG